MPSVERGEVSLHVFRDGGNLIATVKPPIPNIVAFAIARAVNAQLATYVDMFNHPNVDTTRFALMGTGVDKEFKDAVEAQLGEYAYTVASREVIDQ